MKSGVEPNGTFCDRMHRSPTVHRSGDASRHPSRSTVESDLRPAMSDGVDAPSGPESNHELTDAGVSAAEDRSAAGVGPEMKIAPPA